MFKTSFNGCVKALNEKVHVYLPTFLSRRVCYTVHKRLACILRNEWRLIIHEQCGRMLQDLPTGLWRCSGLQSLAEWVASKTTTVAEAVRTRTPRTPRAIEPKTIWYS